MINRLCRDCKIETKEFGHSFCSSCKDYHYMINIQKSILNIRACANPCTNKNTPIYTPKCIWDIRARVTNTIGARMFTSIENL